MQWRAELLSACWVRDSRLLRLSDSDRQSGSTKLAQKDLRRPLAEKPQNSSLRATGVLVESTSEHAFSFAYRSWSRIDLLDASRRRAWLSPDCESAEKSRANAGSGFAQSDDRSTTDG